MIHPFLHLWCRLTALTALLPGIAGAAFPMVYLKPVVQRQIHAPTTITWAPDGSGRLFVCDQPGKIYIIEAGMLRPTPFLNLASSANPAPDNGPGPVVEVTTNYSERGLLGLAFHPGFADPLSPGHRKFYVNYTKPNAVGEPAPPQAGDPVACITVIDEFEVSPTDPNLALPGSQRRVLAFTQPQNNHNGGGLEFGPDGMLFIGSGDGGGSNDNGTGHTGREVSTTSCLGNAQDKTRFLGKLLRINPLDPDGGGPLTYSIPADNPFFNDATPGLKKEIYAYGLRNPWKFSFDRRPPNGTNRLFCLDVGQLRIEEINLIVAGGNYGWRYKEGFELPTFSSGASLDPMPHPGGSLIDPIAMYAHPGVTTNPPLPQLGVSGTGGFVYRGTAIPALQGKYVFGDYGTSDGRIMGLEETAPNSGVFTLTQAVPLLGRANPVTGQRILCLGEDQSGELYFGMKSTGGVLALDNGFPAGSIFKVMPVQSGNASVIAAKDNTIFSDSAPQPPITGYPSDALGYLYAGRTGTNHGPYLRRALMFFDVSATLPAGSVIQSAQLRLQLTKFGPNGFGKTFSLHRLTESWGEGTSVNASDVGYGAQATTNDATWVRRFFDTTSWTTPGGSFSATVSASAPASSVDLTFGSNTQLVSDVQGWLDAPASNAGWTLRGDEASNETVIQVASVQKGSQPPTLNLTYSTPPAPSHFETWLAANFPNNHVGQWIDPNGDSDGDSVPNQIEYAYGLAATAYDYETNFTTAVTPAAGGGTEFTVTFRRDPEAIDLTYRLQVDDNLAGWTTIAQSTGGGSPAGQNGGVVVADDDISGQFPFRLVTVRISLPAGTHAQFVRLSVDRQP